MISPVSRSEYTTPLEDRPRLTQLSYIFTTPSSRLEANPYQVLTPSPLPLPIKPSSPSPRPLQLVLRMQFRLIHCPSLTRFSADRTLRRCTFDRIHAHIIDTPHLSL